MTPSVAREALVIMAKAPRVGRVKTRLAGALGSERAAVLYACFLRDAIAIAEAVARRRSSLGLVVCHAPDDDPAEFAGIAPPGAALLAQRGADLGARLENCMRDVLAAGASVVGVIGADSPTLPPEIVSEAFDAIARGADVALGPASDGGYYLVAARSVHEALFRDMAWSTDRIFAETVARADALGLELHELAPWYDVDEPADLERLRRDLARSDAGAQATRAFLAS